MQTSPLQNQPGATDAQLLTRDRIQYRKYTTTSLLPYHVQYMRTATGWNQLSPVQAQENPETLLCQSV